MSEVSPGCPACGSANVHPRPNLGDWTCLSCGHAWRSPRDQPGATAVQPVRIFLSYGHDLFLRDALRIKADMEARGHKVWFDEERLLAGRDWERYIEDGLRWCDKVLVLMTPHSVRRRDPHDPESRDGFCLNELAKAIERNKLIIPVLLVELEEGPPTSICRIQYLDLRDAVPIEQREPRYRAHMARLFRALEEDDLDFEGGQARLAHVLQPLSFDAEIRHHISRYHGRRWLHQQLDDWLADANGSRVLWLTGPPGVGKTALAVHLCHMRREVVAMHLCRYGHEDKADPRRALLSLAYQMAQHLGEYARHLQSKNLAEEALKSTATLFDTLIVQPLAGLRPPDNGVRLIVIDALDEATLDGRNLMAECVADLRRQGPAWLRLLVTSRPEPEVVAALAGAPALFLEAGSEENLADLREFLATAVTPDGRSLDEATIRRIVDHSGGLFLYGVAMLEELAHGGASATDLSSMPVGLGGHYDRFFRRRFPEIETYRSAFAPIIACLCAARGPLPLPYLAQAVASDEPHLRDRLRAMGSLFPITRDANASPPQETVTMFHHSVREWLTETDPRTGYPRAGAYAVAPGEGNRRLADAGWRAYRLGFEAMPAYARAHLPTDLAAASRWDDLAQLLTDPSYLEGRAESGAVYDLALAIRNALAKLPSEHDGRGLLRRIHHVVGRHLHFLARHGEALFPCVWNQSVGAKALEGTIGALHAWRYDWSERHGGMPWVRSLRPPPDPPASDPIAVFGGHVAAVRSVAFRGDGAQLASGSDDCVVRVWQRQSGQPLHTLIGHTDAVLSVAYSPDGLLLASGARDKTVRVWQGASGAKVAELKGPARGVTGVAWFPDGVRVAGSSRDGTIEVWRLPGIRPILVIQAEQGQLHAVSVSPDGDRIATGGDDGVVRVFDAESGAAVSTYAGHGGPVTSVCFSANDGRLAAAWQNGTVGIWDGQTGKALVVWKERAGTNAIVWSPDSRRLAVATVDRGLNLRATRDGDLAQSREGLEAALHTLAVAPDDGALAGAGADGNVRVWPGRNSAAAPPLPNHSMAVTCLAVAVAADRHTVFSGSRDGTVGVWDVESGRLLRLLAGQGPPIRNVWPSPEGDTVRATDGARHTITWDLATGELTEVDQSVAIVPRESPDVEAGPWRVLRGDGETGFCRSGASQPVAWFPAAIGWLHCWVDDRTLAGVAEGGHHVYLLTIEEGD